MNVMIYGIGGLHNEQPVGRAYDALTAASLLRYLRQEGATGCSLHGTISPDKPAISGEMSIQQALDMVAEVGSTAGACNAREF